MESQAEQLMIENLSKNMSDADVCLPDWPKYSTYTMLTCHQRSILP